MELENLTTSGGENNTATAPCSLQMYDSTDYKVQAALRSSVGLVSFICCAAVVIIIVLFKKYKFYTQRLILYLAITTTLHAFSYTLTRVNYYTPREIEDRYCYFGGLLNHYTAANSVLSIWCITLDLLVKSLCNRSTVKAEPILVVVIFFLPMLWSWVPVYLKAYGTYGGWCSIRVFNADCSLFSYRTWLRFGLWYVPLYSLMFVILICTVLVAIRAARESRKWTGKYDPEIVVQRQTLKKEIMSLFWYPLIFLLLNTFSLIDQIYDAINPMEPSNILIYLRIFTSTLRGAFIALAYSLDSETRGRLRPVQCKAACLEWVPGRRQTIEDYSIRSSSYEESYVPYQSMNQNRSEVR